MFESSRAKRGKYHFWWKATRITPFLGGGGGSRWSNMAIFLDQKREYRPMRQCVKWTLFHAYACNPLVYAKEVGPWTTLNFSLSRADLPYVGGEKINKHKTHKYFSDDPCGTIVPKGPSGQKMAIRLWNLTENGRFVPGTGPPVCPRDGPRLSHGQFLFVPNTVQPKMFSHFQAFGTVTWRMSFSDSFAFWAKASLQEARAKQNTP